MIKVVTGTTVKRDDPAIISPNTTIRSHLESKGYDAAHGTFSLNGTFLSSGDLDKMFSEFPAPSNGVWTLLDVVKARNA